MWRFKTLRRNQSSGFTLFELLVTLMLSALVLSFVQQLIVSSQHSYDLLIDDYTHQWQHFTLLMQRELESFYYRDHTSQRLSLVSCHPNYKNGQIALVNRKLIKQPGHQPYCYSVKHWSVVYNEPIVTLTVEFLNHQEFQQSFYLPPEPESEQ